jgi:hypothetical protein
MNGGRHSTQINQAVLVIWSQLFIGYYLYWRHAPNTKILVRPFVRRITHNSASGTARTQVQVSYFFYYFQSA